MMFSTVIKNGPLITTTLNNKTEMKVLKTIALSTLCMLAVTGCSKGASTNDDNENVADASEVVNTDTESETAVEDMVEPEPENVTDDNSATSGDLVVEGVAIKKGAPIAETLKKFKKISWEYNADFGIIARIGDAWIVVDEADDITPQGREFMNTITSDMVPDLQFSINYIKPTAKIKEFHDK
jgi:hypothetical protein